MAVETFTHLYARGGRAPGAAAVEEKYSIAEIKKRAVVRDAGGGCFRVFPSWDEFWDWERGVPPEARAFHEIVFGDAAQRLKFDVDAPEARLLAIAPSVLADFCPGLGPDAPPAARADAVLSGIIDTVLDELAAVYYDADGVCPSRPDLVVTDSSGGGKFSFHVVVRTFAVANAVEARGFTARVLDALPAPVRELVDPGVNRSLQNFRVPGSVKAPGDPRRKTVVGRFGTAEVANRDALVAPGPGARVLSEVFADAMSAGDLGPAAECGLGRADVAAVLRVAAGSAALASHEFTRAIGRGLLLFRRTRPGPCGLCRRAHDSDNTLMLALERVAHVERADDDGRPLATFRVVERCRRALEGAGAPAAHAGGASVSIIHGNTNAGGASVSIIHGNVGKTHIVHGELELPDFEAAEGARAGADRASVSTVEARVAALLAGRVNPHHANETKLESARGTSVYARPQMRPFEEAATLCVKAGMGLGKTKALREYIDRHFADDGFRPPRICLVSFRQTFSNALRQGAFADFALYSDHKGLLDGARYPRLIVQAESLHRVPVAPGEEPPDLLVLDECESIFGQFNSGLHRNFTESFAVFQWMIANAGRVVCMDANLGDRTARVLETLRPAHPAFFHWNQHQRGAGDTFRFTGDFVQWLDELLARLAAGQRLVVPMNSLAEAEAVVETIGRRFPRKRARLYSSRTSAAEKAAHFADVRRHWSDLDVLVYTPTVSAGVSYEEAHFDALFGYFTHASCDVETCRQMLGRVRDVRLREFVICLRGVWNNLPTEVAQIRRLVHDKRSRLFRAVRETAGDAGAALAFEYTAGGEVRPLESPYFRLWLENVRVVNLSRNAFVARFIDQVADTGARVEVLRAAAADLGARERLAALSLEHKTTRADCARTECAAIAAARPFTDDEASAVRDALAGAGDVTPEDRLSFMRYRLCETFRWHGREMGAGFVEAYRPPGVARVFKNLGRITDAPTVVAALRGIQELEAGAHRDAIEGRMRGGFSQHDLGFGPARGLGPAPDASRAEVRDLSYRYVFEAHYFAVWLLRICGFVCLLDPAQLPLGAVHGRLKSEEAAFLRNLDAICAEFGFRRPSARLIVDEDDPGRYVQRVLSVVNTALRAMYGREVRRSRAPKGGGGPPPTYFLAWTKTGALFRVVSPAEFAAAAAGPPDPRPFVVSQLRPVDYDAARAITDEYYARAPDADLAPDVDPASDEE